MKKYTIEELMRLDDEIYNLAVYEASNGLLPVVKTNKDAFDFQSKVIEKFNEFKSGIQKGRWDMDFLRNNVYSKNAAIHIDPEEMIEDILQGNDGSSIKKIQRFNDIPSVRDFQDLLFKRNQEDNDITE